MDHTHKVEVQLVHPVDVGQATQYLLHHLGCDDWFVACQHEHQFIARLTKGEVARYAVSFECTPPVEKAIYHGSKTRLLSIIPLHPEDELRDDAVREVRAGLAGLAYAD
jgi:hypothetical protein